MDIPQPPAGEAAMTDWADEFSKELEKEIWHQEGDHRYPCEYGLDLGVVAAALRKAKADGMREAAEFCDEDRSPEFWDDFNFLFHHRSFATWLLDRADAIEKGEP